MSIEVQKESEIKTDSHNQIIPYGWDAHLTILVWEMSQ